MVTPWFSEPLAGPQQSLSLLRVALHERSGRFEYAVAEAECLAQRSLLYMAKQVAAAHARA